MSTPRIVFVTGSNMPKPDRETHLLLSALSEINVIGAIEPWDKEMEWSRADAVLLRTPWDYPERLTEFLTWTEKVSRITCLLNPAGLIKWNSDKAYMLDLESTGVPIVPTTLLRRAAQPGLCAQIDIAHDFEIVVKPTVGLNAIGVRRGQAGDPAMLQHVTNLLTTGDVLLQPFVADVTVSGEVSLVYVDGAYSHAVRKQPAASDYRVQDSYGGAVMLHMPAKAEFDVAEAALAAAPEPALYARVDLVQYRGAPVVMELELIEPELFLRYSPQAILPLALAIKARVS